MGVISPPLLLLTLSESGPDGAFPCIETYILLFVIS